MTPGPVHALDNAGFDWIAAIGEHNRNCNGRGLSGQSRVGRSPCENHVHFLADEFGCKDRQLVVLLSTTNLNRYITAFNIAHFAKALTQSGESVWIGLSSTTGESDYRHGLLPAHHEPPRGRGAESQDELAPPCMTRKEHSERRLGFGHDRFPVA